MSDTRAKNTLAMMGALASLGAGDPVLPGLRTAEKNSWKPELTEDELTRLRSLPKRDRKIYLEELRQKYLKEGQNETEST